MRFPSSLSLCKSLLSLSSVFVILASTPIASAQHSSSSSISVLAKTPVNTFIGTQDDGNTFPGASAPFGMIQVSPIGEHYSGWRYTDPKIRGFGHFFLSGAGCWEQGGQLSVLPVTGSIGPGGDFDTSKANSFDHKKYASNYTHDGEVGTAGYFKMQLTSYGGITAENTALTRVAAERYTFAANQNSGHILVNVGQANERHSVAGSSLQVIDDHTLEAKIVTLSFCGGTKYTTWYRMEFNRPFKTHGVWNEVGGKEGVRSLSQQGEVRPHGAWFSFDLSHDKSVTAVTSISHVDIQGARRNLGAEGKIGETLMSFDAMREKAQALWAKELNSIRITGGSQDERTVFYTALYHTLLQPLTGNDVDGRYRGWDNQIHTTDRRTGETYYEFFSLWDTYRAQNQMLALLRPQRAKDIANSVLKIHEQSGWLPRWGYASYETNVMTGDPVTPFLVDLWRYGALKGKEKQAYAALRQNAFGVPDFKIRAQGRAGNPSYLQLGFVQYDRAFPAKGMDVDPHHGGSATLEYAQGDAALAMMAQALGKKEDAAILRKRGANWRQVWDNSVVDQELGFKGFPRARIDGGDWYTEIDGSYSPRSEHGFHEGTAWQYQWLVQQDVPGLVSEMGGREMAGKRLDAFFALEALQKDPQHAVRKEWVVGPYSYYNQYRYNPNNEPDLHAPWIYTHIGQPWKTAIVARAADILFSNAPNGVTGNDDLGTMSAWYLFSALGLYPSTPGTGQFLLHAPKFINAEIDLGNGKTLTINSLGHRTNTNNFIHAARFNGKAQDKVFLDWEALQQGGTLEFQMNDRFDQNGWGTQSKNLPQGLSGRMP
ncbi:GH92 family glycosyl hydrolase [Undibacterium cyanobacteriorum]|uniref:GH92 family glycosyl hydrolase n=1 Tax=Undibacterium cyanobacteriorum TaxID=3073561 RepID=A0ABY9RFN0_9BURK|nr:GH92 family glycosyl hydrolase [Undibacterium sp. 20NA77.5]WMW80024.1 GH92 family glycosyl hydrolase [Undibacterium sp. 20NA77.5]